MIKSLPFSQETIVSLVEQSGTPFYLYDEQGIQNTARTVTSAFSHVSQDYRNFFAVKALPNPHILKILVAEGMGLDCSSYAELLLAEMIGVRGRDVMFTSNNTPLHEFQKAADMGACINLDDYSHIGFLNKHQIIPQHISFRYNPGSLKTGNKTIGLPEEAKYGLTREQLLQAYLEIVPWKCETIGLHTMVASNELDLDYFVDTAKMMFELVVELYNKTKIGIDYVNLGGGIGIPYHPDQEPIDVYQLATSVRKHYDAIIKPTALDPLGVVTENGRAITGPHGFLFSKVLHKKSIYREYVGLDACMANLMRPGIYGAYHHLTVLGKEDTPATHVYDVTGSLCENNDKFAIQRQLPPIAIGDIVGIYDCGAHGHAMGFNYNGKLRSKELLMRVDGSVECIRRAETHEDLFATITPLGS